MTWNYRIIKHRCPSRITTGEIEWFQIHEVYYDKDGKIELWSAEGCLPSGETKEELMADVEMMMQAFDRPILNAEDMPK